MPRCCNRDSDTGCVAIRQLDATPAREGRSGAVGAESQFPLRLDGEAPDEVAQGDQAERLFPNVEAGHDHEVEWMDRTRCVGELNADGASHAPPAKPGGGAKRDFIPGEIAQESPQPLRTVQPAGGNGGSEGPRVQVEEKPCA